MQVELEYEQAKDEVEMARERVAQEMKEHRKSSEASQKKLLEALGTLQRVTNRAKKEGLVL